MLQLVSVKEVTEAMGLSESDISGNTKTVESAIERATLHVEVFLGAPVRRATSEDYFYVNDNTGAPLNGFYRLRLGCPFVKASGLTVTYGPSMDDLPNTMTGTILDGSRGVLQVPKTHLQAYVKVQYTSGFEEGDDLPDELRQAIICHTPLALLTATAGAMDPKVATSAMKRALTMSEQGDVFMRRFHREVGAVIKPLLSTISLVE